MSHKQIRFIVIGVSFTSLPQISSPHIRPVNLSTDLSKLADLIEIAFANSMDSGGRAVLRNMRAMSGSSIGVRLNTWFNELALGMGTGFVWEQDGKLVGNVSIVKSNWPSDLGNTYIIANVATHPAYQRRGIAQRLLEASLKHIQRSGGHRAILQVEMDNPAARHVYKKIGFVEERGWRLWRRGAYNTLIPKPFDSDFYLRSRRRSEWQDEFSRVGTIRPNERGGLGWLRPLHPHQFRRTFWQKLLDWANLRGMERLVAYDYDANQLVASMWIEHQFGGQIRMTLLNDPQSDPLAAESLIHNLLRRYPRSTINVEHPADDLFVNELLQKYDFTLTHSFIHMRWESH